MAAMNFGDDHIGRLVVTLVILIAWFVILLAKPEQAQVAGTIATLAIGHYFGRESKAGDGK